MIGASEIGLIAAVIVVVLICGSGIGKGRRSA